MSSLFRENSHVAVDSSSIRDKIGCWRGRPEENRIRVVSFRRLSNNLLYLILFCIFNLSDFYFFFLPIIVYLYLSLSLSFSPLYTHTYTFTRTLSLSFSLAHIRNGTCTRIFLSSFFLFHSLAYTRSLIVFYQTTYRLRPIY